MLKEISTRAPEDWNKEETKVKTAEIKTQLDELQNRLYAEQKHAVLVVIQGMDASGKDGAIKNVFGGINPQGVTVKSFKAPTAEELSHDFLWRIHRHAPAKGMIGIFNRSHYEDVVITRVHGWCDDETAKKRFAAINDFETMLARNNNTQILKFYLHISKKEQEERLKERIADPTKNWKYNANDLEEAKLWDKYMSMYEEAFANTGDIPWHIIPADQNWCKEFMIAGKLLETLQQLNSQYPALKGME